MYLNYIAWCFNLTSRSTILLRLSQFSKFNKVDGASSQAVRIGYKVPMWSSASFIHECVNRPLHLEACVWATFPIFCCQVQVVLACKLAVMPLWTGNSKNTWLCHNLHSLKGDEGTETRIGAHEDHWNCIWLSLSSILQNAFQITGSNMVHCRSCNKIFITKGLRGPVSTMVAYSTILTESISEGKGLESEGRVTWRKRGFETQRSDHFVHVESVQYKEKINSSLWLKGKFEINPRGRSLRRRQAERCQKLGNS